MAYSELIKNFEKVRAYHAAIYLALKYAMKTDMVPQTTPWRGVRAKVGCDRFQSRNADHQTNSH